MPPAGGVILIEQYFYPDGWGGAQLPRDIAAAICSCGMEIAVLCGTEQYVAVRPELAGPDPASQGVRVLRIPRLLPGPPRTLRMARTIWFCVCALLVVSMRRGSRLILTQTNPPLVIPMMALAAQIRRVPLVIIAQDLYPEVLFANANLKEDSWPGRMLRWIFSWAYRRAHKVIVLGPYMAKRVRAKGVAAERIVAISNWATGQLGDSPRENPLRVRWNLQNRFVALYSGNLGLGHEFETLLQGVRKAAERTAQLVLVFIGRGSRYEEVRTRTQELGLGERVRFFDYVSAEELPSSIGLADVAVVTLRAGFEGVIVPSKFFGYMARGVPTLYVGPESDVTDIIRSADCGVICAPGQSEAVAQFLTDAAANPALLERWRANARSTYERKFGRELALETYVSLLRDTLDCSNR